MARSLYKGLRTEGLVISGELQLKKTVPVAFEGPCRLGVGSLTLRKPLRLGAYSFVRTGILRNLAEIGRYCSIGPNVIIGEAEHPIDWLSTSTAFYDAPLHFDFYPAKASPIRKHPHDNGEDVRIGNDVWIGANVVIRSGVTIGDGAVIGAGAVVVRDVEPYAVMGGVPARKIRDRFSDNLIEALLNARWWEFDARDFADAPISDPTRTLEIIAERESRGEIVRQAPYHREVLLGVKGYKFSKPAGDGAQAAEA